MRSRILINGAICIWVTCSFGCASIVSQSKYKVEISSNTPGAKVVVLDNSGKEIHKGTTPTSVILSAKGGYFTRAAYTVNFEKTGFLSTRQTLSAKFDPWYIGNFVFGPFCFMGYLVVDPITGAMWRINPSVEGVLLGDPAIKEELTNKDDALDNMPESKESQKNLDELKALGVITDEEYQRRRKNQSTR